MLAGIYKPTTGKTPMNKITTSTWSILRIVILAFLIVGAVDVILIVAAKFRSTVQSGSRISRLSDLHLDIDPNRVVASYEVYLRKDHPLFIHAERDWSKAAAERISNEALGAVSVSGERLKFERLETSIADTWRSDSWKQYRSSFSWCGVNAMRRLSPMPAHSNDSGRHRTDNSEYQMS